MPVGPSAVPRPSRLGRKCSVTRLISCRSQSRTTHGGEQSAWRGSGGQGEFRGGTRNGRRTDLAEPLRAPSLSSPPRGHRLSSPHRALVAASGRRPFVGSETSRSSYRPLSYLPLSPRPLARSLAPRASAVSHSRTRISLDLLNTAMTALQTPSIFSYSYLLTRKKRLRKFWLPHNVETFSLS